MTSSGRRGWLAPLGLMLITLVLSVFQPILLVMVPFAFLGLGGSFRTLSTALLGVAVLFLALGGSPAEGSWLLERGWAVLVGGVFLTAALVRPSLSVTDRAILTVLASTGLAAGFLAIQTDAWQVLDWLVRSRVLDGASAAVATMEVVRGELGVSPKLVQAVFRTAEFQGRVFPALTGLATASALGVSWWLYVRISLGKGNGLAPLGTFRFNDGLVWLFIGGLVPLVAGLGDPWQRMGVNALVFMGGLYALRGMAVVVAVNGGATLFGTVLLVIGLVLATPVILFGALAIGLGDTWLDLRARAAAVSSD